MKTRPLSPSEAVTITAELKRTRAWERLGAAEAARQLAIHLSDVRVRQLDYYEGQRAGNATRNAGVVSTIVPPPAEWEMPSPRSPRPWPLQRRPAHRPHHIDRWNVRAAVHDLNGSRPLFEVESEGGVDDGSGED